VNNRRRPVKLTHNRSWYRIENRSTSPTIHLYDEIGEFGIAASDFVKDLQDIDGDVTVHVNSPGGSVFDGLAIYQALQSRAGNVHVIVDGLAASAATIVAMGGDKVSIAKHAQMMIHESHAVGVGNAKDMRALADLLDKCSERIAGTYADKAGGTTAEWRERMGRETWYSSDEAVEAGLADEVIPGRRVRNDWNLTIFNYAGRANAPDPFTQWAIGERGPESITLTQPATISPVSSTEIVNAPVVDLTGEPDPPPEPDDPAAEPGLLVPDITDTIRAVHEIRFDPAVFRAAVELAINDVPAPDPPKPPAPAEEPLVAIDLPAVRRALKEAAL
jgi:ATP-dependent Clp endopeptidase proteolytic subunit ClpP